MSHGVIPLIGRCIINNIFLEDMKGPAYISTYMYMYDVYTLGGSTIFQKFEFDLVQLIHGAYHISKHSEGN